MDYELRQLQDGLIDLINSYEALPWEAKRLVVDSVLNLVEKKADEEIRKQIVMYEHKEDANAKGIPENQLGELSK